MGCCCTHDPHTCVYRVASTHMVIMMAMDGYARITRWRNGGTCPIIAQQQRMYPHGLYATAKDVFQYDKLLFPVNHVTPAQWKEKGKQGFHWTLGCINFRDRRIE